MLTEDQISELRRLMELRQDRDETEKAAKEAKSAYQEAELELFERLDEGALRRLNNVDLGPPWGRVSFGARETYYGRIIPGMEDDALEYFERRGMVDELTAPKFVSRRINEIVRDVIEQGNMEDMPPGVDYYARRGVTITRQKGQ